MIPPLACGIGASVVYDSLAVGSTVPRSSIDPRPREKSHLVQMEYPAIFAILLLGSNVVKRRGLRS
jgi:hypothetical protein